MDNHINKSTLNDVFEELLGQNFTESTEDRQGCSMGRNNSTWMCPKLITEIVIRCLNEADVLIIEDVPEDVDDDPEPDFDPENIYNQGSVAQSIAEDKK